MMMASFLVHTPTDSDTDTRTTRTHANAPLGVKLRRMRADLRRTGRVVAMMMPTMKRDIMGSAVYIYMGRGERVRVMPDGEEGRDGVGCCVVVRV